MRFLVQVTATLPPTLAGADRVAMLDAELRCGRDLHAAGVLEQVWTVTGDGIRNVGIWHAEDREHLDRILATLPLAPWLSTHVSIVEPLDFDAAIDALSRRSRASG